MSKILPFKRRIYVASSFSNTEPVLRMVALLRKEGHDVDCFMERNEKRLSLPREWDSIDAINVDERVIKRYQSNMDWMTWANTCVLILPSGKSSHLEGGWMKGQDKLLFIYGEFTKGDYDAMYGMADGLYRPSMLGELLHDLHFYKKKEG